MSNDKKKALLNEQTTKRFWKLAGLKPIHEKAYVFEEDEDLEEGMDRAKEDEEDVKKEGMDRAKEDEEDVKKEGMDRAKEDEDEDVKKEGMDRAKEDEELDEMGMPPAAEDDLGAEDPVPEEPGMEDEGPEDGQDVEVDVPEGDVASLKTARDILDQILDAVEGGEEPEMGMDDDPGEEDPALQEEDEVDLNEVEQEELEEIAERIAARVAKRIQESFSKKSK